MTDFAYIQCARFCQYMKYIHGADFVNSTLRRHSDLKNALTDYERKRIIKLEREILKSEVSDNVSNSSC